MRNEQIILLFFGRRSGTAEAVSAEVQISMLPTAAGHFGQSPNTLGWSKQLRCSCRAQLLLCFTHKRDTLQALRLPCMIGSDDLLKLQSHGQNTVMMWTHSHKHGTEMPQSRKSLDSDNKQHWVLKKQEKLHLMIPMTNNVTLWYVFWLNQSGDDSRIWLISRTYGLSQLCKKKNIYKTRNAETYGTLFLTTWKKMLLNSSSCLLFSKAILSPHLFSKWHYYSINRIWSQVNEIAQFLATFILILLNNHDYNDFINKSH